MPLNVKRISHQRDAAGRLVANSSDCVMHGRTEPEDPAELAAKFNAAVQTARAAGNQFTLVGDPPVGYVLTNGLLEPEGSEPEESNG